LAGAHFAPSLFRFLRQLAENNEREWFLANKTRYERDVRDPLLAFVSDVAPALQRISREIVADPRPVGGSMFRIHRDTRFSKDKRPYKTHAAAHFRHRARRDAHAPGFYLHLEPGNVFAGAGIWRPDGPAAGAIRDAILENEKLWRSITRSRRFRARCRLEGGALKRPPRGFDPAHPLVDDLKRKDFTVVERFRQGDAIGPRFLSRFVRFCEAAAPFNEFLARSLALDW
jgi:uncharacterized protein (TIGR02453 family)